MQVVAVQAASKMRSVHGMRGVPFIAAHTPKVSRLALVPSPLLSVRCMAGKSWSDIASDAMEVAKEAATKISESIAGKSDQERARSVPQQQRPPSRSGSIFKSPGGVVGGLVGGLVGKIVEGALQGAVRMVEEQTKASAALYESAAMAVEADAGVASRLGAPLRCGPVMAQSSSTSSINGRTTQDTSIQFMVDGPRGSGRVAVDASEGAGVPKRVNIRVQLSNGEVLPVDERGGGGGRGRGSSGRVYDATWEEVK